MTEGVTNLHHEVVMDLTLGFDERHPDAWNHEDVRFKAGAPVSGTDGVHMSHHPATNASSIGSRPGNMVALPDESTNCMPPFVHHSSSSVLRPLQQTEYPYIGPLSFHSGLPPHGSDHTVAASLKVYPDYSVLSNTYANQPQGVLVPNHIDVYDLNVVKMPFATVLY